MTTLEQAARQALEALEAINNTDSYWWQEVDDKTIKLLEYAEKALREALEQPKQEPVAVVTGYYAGYPVVRPLDPQVVFCEQMALYTEPPQREWVGLTDSERLEAAEIDGADEWFWKVCKAIEAKLKEKNT